MTQSVLGRYWSVWTGEHRFPETRGLRRRRSVSPGDTQRVIELRWYVAMWAVALAAGYACAVAANVAVRAFTTYRPHNNLEEVFTDRSITAVLLLAVVIAPLLEETAFRLPATRTPWAIGLGVAALVTMVADSAGLSAVDLIAAHSDPWVRRAAYLGQVVVLAVTCGLIARAVLATAKPSERADRRFRQAVAITLTLVFALLHTLNFAQPNALTAVFVLPQLFVGSVLMFARVDRSWWLGVALHALNNGVASSVALAGRASAQVGTAVSGLYLLALFAGGLISLVALISEHRAVKANSRLPTITLTDSPATRAEEALALTSALANFGACALALPSELVSEQQQLDRSARAFFDLPNAQKDRIAMRHGGAAWRGWFPVGAELTSGIPDQKEGVYFGRELDAATAAGRPLAGPNLWPDDVPELRACVELQMARMEHLGRHVMDLIGEGLGAPPGTTDAILGPQPTVLFRMFHYPQSPSGADHGVGEHTDYGLLTLLATNGEPGLQIRTNAGWVDAPSDRGLLILNVGETLSTLTGGRLPAALHRVRPVDADRRSYPFFLDPAWEYPVDAAGTTYGDFLVSKVSRVFPALAAEVFGGSSPGDEPASSGTVVGAGSDPTQHG